MGKTFNDILTNIGERQRQEQSAELQPFRSQLLQAQAQQTQQRVLSDREKSRLTSLGNFAAGVLPSLRSDNPQEALTQAKSRLTRMQQTIADNPGIQLDTTETQEFINLLESGDGQDQLLATERAEQAFQLAQSQGLLGRQVQQTAGQRERQSLLETLDDPNASEIAKQSARIALGTEARAVGAAAKTVDVGGVPHVFDPVKQTLVPARVSGEQVTAETVGESKATIRQREKFGELTGSSRAKTIDKGFERIAGITKNINTIDRAVAALDRGAGTGAAEQFFPSIKAATRELNQIQDELALDVIGSVTFGALSQGELELAQRIALDTGLDEPALRDLLGRKKAAQEKLRNYFNEQIQFLDQGGTVAGFLRSKQPQTTRLEDLTIEQLQQLSTEELQRLSGQ